MFKPTLKQKIIHFYEVNTRKIRSKNKRKKLLRTDFTIISNDCWGGITYEEYGLIKQSPTIGCYFFAQDYVKFVENFEQYIAMDLKFISLENSKNKIWIIENKNENCPIGKLGDIEIVFMHYLNPEDAITKWNRRIKRINRDNLIFKFSQMNHATEQNLLDFDNLELPGKKLMFVNKENMGFKCGVYYKGFECEEQIYNDTYFGNRYFDITSFLNS